MNNVKKLFFGLAALAILCFFTAPVVWAGQIASNSLDGQWFKLKVKSAGYTSTYDASTDITGKKIFKNKKVYVHFDWEQVNSGYNCQAYTRRDDSSGWAETGAECGHVMINTAKKYMILPMSFVINKDKTDLPEIYPEAFLKFKVKTNINDVFKHSVVKSFTGISYGIWSDDPVEEEFVGNCTIIGNSVKWKKLPPELQVLHPVVE